MQFIYIAVDCISYNDFSKINQHDVGCTSSTTKIQVSIADMATDYEAYDKRIRMLSGDSIYRYL